MNLAEFFKLVTGLKTACTHAGLDPNTATIQIHSIDDVPSDINVTGEGEHGKVTLHFQID
jgi:hypothetical protein